MIAYAVILDPEVQTIWDNIRTMILYPIVTLMFAVALLYFLWGVVKYIRADQSSEDRQNGARHMLWGIIGMAIMLSAIGIVIFVNNTVTGGQTGYDGHELQTPSLILNGKL